MLTYKGGSTVGRGTYWDIGNGRRVDVLNEAVLTGSGAATYVRVSSGVMLLAGPVLGLLYAILMPFIGIATVGALGGRVVLEGMYNLAVKSVSFGWRPKSAYLSGKKKNRDKK